MSRESLFTQSNGNKVKFIVGIVRFHRLGSLIPLSRQIEN